MSEVLGNQGFCASLGCPKKPTYNYDGIDEPKLCKDHKKKGMRSKIKRSSGIRKHCGFVGCNARGYWFSGEKPTFKFCQQHKIEGMSSTNQKRCLTKNCVDQAYYGYPGTGHPRISCRIHKQDGMVFCKRRITCEYDGCERCASYDFEGGKGKRFCSFHKLPGMVTKGKKLLCMHEGCVFPALYNFENETRRRFCSQHKMPGMVIPTFRKCELESCTRGNPQFNFRVADPPVGRFCQDHKMEGMVNLMKFCRTPGCDKLARFSLESWRSPQFCIAHKSKKMFDMKRPRCMQAGCIQYPQYNTPGERKAIFCKVHKGRRMVKVWGQKCQMDGCKEVPTYALDWKHIPKFCGAHKTNLMVEVTTICEYKDCNLKACFHSKGEKVARFCHRHKLDGMVVLTQKRCVFARCFEGARYGYHGEKRTRCYFHRTSGMVRDPLVCRMKQCRQKRSQKGNTTNSPNYCISHQPSLKSCVKVGCSHQALFNYKSFYQGVFCAEHKAPKMINMTATCTYEQCERVPVYSERGQTQPLFCAEHRESGMINVVSSECQRKDCTLVPLFNYPNMLAQWCYQHKQDGMVEISKFIASNPKTKKKQEYSNSVLQDFQLELQISNPVKPLLDLVEQPLSGTTNKTACEIENCDRKAMYKFVYESAVRLCSHHRLDGMTTLSAKVCEKEGCSQLARYKFKNDPHKRFCHQHKLPRMGLKLSQFCHVEDCNLYAIYKTEDSAKKACKIHKEPHMFSIVHLRKYGKCHQENCLKLATFDFAHSEKPKFCSDHRLPNMVKLLRERGSEFRLVTCSEDGCEAKAVYFPEKDIEQKVCKQHQLKEKKYFFICWSPDCSQPALFVQRGTGDSLARKKSCADHKSELMVSIDEPKCEVPDCLLKASHNFRGNMEGKFCVKHSLDGMVNISPAFYLCDKGSHCFKLPVFNFPGQTQGRFCASHKQAGMVDISSIKCQSLNCAKRPRFNYPDALSPVFCWEHYFDEMVDLLKKSCSEKTCDLEGLYHRTDQPGLFCRFHGNVGKNPPQKHCEFEGCLQPPKYRLPGEETHRLCQEHKEEGMVCSNKKYCVREGCTIRASYGLPGATIDYCARHKTPGMLPLGRTCLHSGCPKFPSYNFPGLVKKQYCAEHKLHGMIVVTKVRRQCCSSGCERRGAFFLEDEPERRFCGKHKTKEMVDFQSFLCQGKGCKVPANFGNPLDGVKRYCPKHKTTGMVLLGKMFSRCCEPRCRRYIALNANDMSIQNQGAKQNDSVKRFCQMHCSDQKSHSEENSGDANEGCQIKRTKKNSTASQECASFCKETDCNQKESHRDEVKILTASRESETDCCQELKVDGHKRFCRSQKESCTAQKQSCLCYQEGCHRFAFYKFLDNSKTACKNHKEDGMISLLHLRKYGICQYGTCAKPASFNTIGSLKPKFCFDHHLAGMVELVSSKQLGHQMNICVEPSCRARALFLNKEYPGEQVCKGHLEKTHQRSDYLLLCWTSGCKQPAFYTCRNSGLNLYCKKSCENHKTEEMVLITVLVCEFQGCLVEASHNFVGNSTGKFCQLHKFDGMIDVRPSVYHCERGKWPSKCFKIPLFCFPGEMQARLCFLHKEEGMVNVVSSQCQVFQCVMVSKFNYPGAIAGAFCWEHHLIGMVDVSYKTCSQKDCNEEAGFQRKDRPGWFCAKHRFFFKSLRRKPFGNGNFKETNDNPSTSVIGEKSRDKRRKYCKVEGCKTRASYGFPGSAYDFCAVHKSAGMQPGKTCMRTGCIKFPSYNYLGQQTRLYCAEHKLEGMIDVKSFKKNCQSKDGCPLPGSFCFKDKSEQRFCELHKTEGMINLHKYFCRASKCAMPAMFGSIEEGERRFCNNHKVQGMVLIEHKPFGCKELKCKNDIAILDSDSWKGLGSFPNAEIKYCLKHLHRQPLFLSHYLRIFRPSELAEKEAELAKKEAIEQYRQEQWERNLQRIYGGNYASRIAVSKEKATFLSKKSVQTKALTQQKSEYNQCAYHNCLSKALYGFSKKSLCSNHKLQGMHLLDEVLI